MQRFNIKEKKAILTYLFSGLILILVLIFSFNLFADYSLKNITIKTNTRNVDFKVKIANSPKEREVGLMNVKYMNENEGMLFIFPLKENLSFWMKDTYIPLDMIFIDENKEIVKIFKNTKPLDTNERYSAKAKYVLEINGNLSDKYGIKEGNKVEFRE